MCLDTIVEAFVLRISKLRDRFFSFEPFKENSHFVSVVAVNNNTSKVVLFFLLGLLLDFALLFMRPMIILVPLRFCLDSSSTLHIQASQG